MLVQQNPLNLADWTLLDVQHPLQLVSYGWKAVVAPLPCHSLEQHFARKGLHYTLHNVLDSQRLWCRCLEIYLFSPLAESFWKHGHRKHGEMGADSVKSDCRPDFCSKWRIEASSTVAQASLSWWSESSKVTFLARSEAEALSDLSTFCRITRQTYLL